RSPPRPEGGSSRGAGGGVARALVGGARQTDGDRRPLAWLGLKLKNAAVRLDELARERKAEAERRLLVSAPLNRALAAGEDSRLMGRNDSAAIVRYDDHRCIGPAFV